MRKIASPEDLQAELRRLLAYSQGQNPSREKLAADLRGLADRTGDGQAERLAATHPTVTLAAKVRATMKSIDRAMEGRSGKGSDKAKAKKLVIEARTTLDKLDKAIDKSWSPSA